MTYAVMAPVILVPGLLFFAMAQVVYRHQLLYVYVPIFESGGRLGPIIYRRTLFSLFIFQFTMTGVLFVKHAYYEGYAVLALSVVTFAYKTHLQATYAKSGSVAHHLPMELACAVDDAMRHREETGSLKTTSPVLQRTDEDDDAILLRGLHEYVQPSLAGGTP
mmetsp:Transcript_5770/g.24032  ORF Transcript_5770/g.24032 Transcript_5770/m.24032 type:complete len:163 (-) Transcript_5770:180-668(-)